MSQILSVLRNRTYILLFLLVVLAAFLRLYRIGDYMTFLGDEGRDVLVVRHILQGQFTLLGPRASAGDFFTGPIYYYMMAPFLWLFHYDPVGPAVMIALLGILTVVLIWYIAQEFFGEKAAFFSAGLYTVSPLVIAYSRSSWNPNPMPFFTLLILYLLYKAVSNRSWKLFLVTGMLYGIAFQLHYIELFVGVIIFFFMLISMLLQLSVRREGFLFLPTKAVKKTAAKTAQEETMSLASRVLALGKGYLSLFFGFLIGFSPFLAFELRHQLANTKTIMNFIFHGPTGATDLTHLSFIQIVSDVFFRLFGRLILRFPEPSHISAYMPLQIQVWELGVLLLAAVSMFYLLKVKDRLVALLILLWLLFGVVLFGFYKKPIYDYYFEFMFPLPFILLGNALARLSEEKRLQRVGLILSGILFVGLFIFNLWGNPFRYEPNRQKQQMETIADFVLSKTNNQPFNFALLTMGNSDHAYRYFFEIRNHAPVTIENEMNDPQRKTVTQQLLVVCEYTDCKPLGNPLFEVAGFGRAEIAGSWNVSVVKVYKLVHYHGK